VILWAIIESSFQFSGQKCTLTTGLFASESAVKKEKVQFKSEDTRLGRK